MTQQSEETLSVLILPKARITTAAIARLITEVSKSTPLYAGLKASHCVSANHTNNVVTMSTGEQLDVLDGFRDKRFNVLVATTVVGEGLDVRACNVVIKTDELANFRSFIRSQRIGESLQSRCIKNVVEDEEEDEITEHFYMSYGMKGPRTTASAHASVLTRYLGSLKTHTSTTPKTLCSVEEVLGGYQGQLLMRPPSSLQEIITGSTVSTKDLAKQLIRLQVSQGLHETGLLNHDLLPVNVRKPTTITSNTNPSSLTDREDKCEELNELVNAMSGSSTEATFHEYLVSQCPSNIGIGTKLNEMISSNEEFPPPIVLCSSLSEVQSKPSEQIEAVEKESALANVQEYCNQYHGVLAYKVLADMVEAIIGAVYIDCSGITSNVTNAICSLLQNAIDAYGKSLPIDPERLMHETFKNMEMTIVESSMKSNADVDSELSARRKTFNRKDCPHFKVMAKYKGQTVTGEGFSKRTAMLQMALKLGIVKKKLKKGIFAEKQIIPQENRGLWNDASEEGRGPT
ncbi:hypothetical protein Aperf_G00000115239 [Anoplocephala perfoliata]